MRRGSTTERGQESRAAILDAALTEFTSNGFRGSSVDAIAQRASITKSGLLHHFGSKDALLAAVLAERAPARGPASREPSPDLFMALREAVARNQRDPSWIRFFTIMVAESFTEKHPALPVVQVRYERVMLEISTLLRERYTSASDEETRQAAALTIAVLDGLQILRLLDENFDMTDAYSLYVRAMENVLKTGASE